MEKKFKKGAKVWLVCATHDPQSKEWEEYELEEDMTEEEVEALAEQFFWDRKEPQWWVSEEKPSRRGWD